MLHENRQLKSVIDSEQQRTIITPAKTMGSGAVRVDASGDYL